MGSLSIKFHGISWDLDLMLIGSFFKWNLMLISTVGIFYCTFHGEKNMDFMRYENVV